MTSRILTRRVQIVYTSIVGVVMLMACLEWFLWLAAFMYCLYKVFRKAEHWSIRVLCFLVGLAFALLRYVLRSGGPRNLGAQGEANVRVAASSSYRSW